jgi:hypothetical protein
MEELHRGGSLRKRDLERIHAGAFIAFQSHIERSIERLFFGTLMGRFAYTRSDVRPLVLIKSEATARAVVLGGRRYIDWLPYKNLTKDRAEAWMSGGRPFSALPDRFSQTFDQMAVMRNALAHESSYALTRFRREFTEGKALPSDQRTPTGYLRGQHTIGQSRFEYLLAEAVSAFERLTQ